MREYLSTGSYANDKGNESKNSGKSPMKRDGNNQKNGYSPVSPSQFMRRSPSLTKKTMTENMKI
jgi:hypothetical protein